VKHGLIVFQQQRSNNNNNNNNKQRTKAKNLTGHAAAADVAGARRNGTRVLHSLTSTLLALVPHYLSRHITT
jgi:hypothetical protein